MENNAITDDTNNNIIDNCTIDDSKKIYANENSNPEESLFSLNNKNKESLEIKKIHIATKNITENKTDDSVEINNTELNTNIQINYNANTESTANLKDNIDKISLNTKTASNTNIIKQTIVVKDPLSDAQIEPTIKPQINQINEQLNPITNKDNINNTNTSTNATSKSKKDPKSMTAQEQADYYKDQFLKTRKLFLHFEKESKTYESKYKKTQDKLNSYEPKAGETVKILYKYKHDKNTFYYIQSNANSYFISENQVKDLFPDVVNDETITLYSFEKDIQEQENTINQIIVQYDERIKRMKNEIEIYEKNFLAYKELKSNSAQLIDSMKKFYDEEIQQIISDSNEVFLLLKTSVDLDYSDEQMQNEVFSNIKNHINIFNDKQISLNSGFKKIKEMAINKSLVNQGSDLFSTKWLNEMKTFKTTILKSYLDKAFKLVKIDSEFHDQKVKWQNTLDQIISSHEEEINSSKSFINIG